MRKVMRPRFYCDYCKVSKGTSQSMKKHEKGCTLNPHRECGMCGMAGNPTTDREAMLAIFAGFSQFGPDDYEDPNAGGTMANISDILAREGRELDARLTKLRELTDNCPACILAALRQSNVATSHEEFDWKKESKQWMGEHSRPYNPGRY